MCVFYLQESALFIKDKDTEQYLAEIQFIMKSAEVSVAALNALKW